MKVAASPRSRAQVEAVLAFVISYTTFLAAQDDETGRCPKVCDGRFFSYRKPSPCGEGLGGATLRVDFYKGRCPKVAFKSLVTVPPDIFLYYSTGDE